MKTPHVILILIVVAILGFLLVYSQQHGAVSQGQGAAGGYGAPASSGYGSAPASGGYGSAPAAGGYGAPPAPSGGLWRTGRRPWKRSCCRRRRGAFPGARPRA